MPSPVESDEYKTSNQTPKKRVSEQGRIKSIVCECERFKPTERSQTDHASSILMENDGSYSKSADNETTPPKSANDGSNDKEEKNPFIVNMEVKSDDVTTCSCSKCSSFACSGKGVDIDSRTKRKRTKNCVCWTIVISVIVSLIIIAGLCFLFYKVLSSNDYKIPENAETDKGDDDNDQHVHTYRTRIHRLGNKLVHTYKTFIHKSPPKAVLTKFSLDTNKMQNSNTIVLPWKLKEYVNNSCVAYSNDTDTVTITESGVYLILLTLNMETHGFPKNTMVTVLPCLKYNHDQEYCQRHVIPSGMTTPVYLEDVIKVKANDKIKVTLSQKKYIYRSSLYNTLTFVRLNHDH